MRTKFQRIAIKIRFSLATHRNASTVVSIVLVKWFRNCSKIILIIYLCCKNARLVVMVEILNFDTVLNQYFFRCTKTFILQALKQLSLLSPVFMTKNSLFLQFSNSVPNVSSLKDQRTIQFFNFRVKYFGEDNQWLNVILRLLNGIPEYKSLEKLTLNSRPYTL